MKLETGSEERFLDFIKNLEGHNVALVSHTDLDGMTCPKIISEVVKPKEIFFVDYVDLNDSLIKKLKERKIEKIIFSDLYIKDKDFVKSLEEFAEVLIIDHHLSEDWNSDKTVFVRGEEGYSAGYLCYYLFSKIRNLEKWDWLVACSCISDYCHIKPKEWLEKVMEKYGDDLKNEEIFAKKTGIFWDLQYKLALALIYFKGNLKKVYDSIGEKFGDVGNLEGHAEEVQKEIENVIERFDQIKEIFEQGFFFEFTSKFPIKSIVASILSGKNVDKIFVILEIQNGLYKVSVRRQDKKIDCDKFLKNLLQGLENASGGGHIPAAGGHFMKKDLPEFRRRLGLD
jgi:single-stranded DNA-specific DHH superfamily exonuclease